MVKTELHFNKPQIRSMLVNAPEEWVVAGRGTGKSEGIIAPKSANYLNMMPRGRGVFVGSTFEQILTRTLPPVLLGWERLGYRIDEHYVIGKRPPEKFIRRWKWEGPFRPILNYQYFISWWNGGGIQLVSQNKVGSSNSLTIDWIMGDEAKLLNRKRLGDELFPTNRGLVPAFKNNPHHHGKLFTTDMPVGTAGRWILDKEKEMNRDTIAQILRIQRVKYDIANAAAKMNKKKTAEFNKQISILDAELQFLRKDLVYYHEASALDNIHALGKKYIKDMRRDLTDFEFNTSILNKRPLKLEDGFYPDLDEEYHGYFPPDNGYLDKLGYKITDIVLDCKKDSDLNHSKALHISLDYNRRIHPMVVGQVYSKELRIINAIDVLYPKKLREAILEFTRYYKPYLKKVVYYWYDHTAVGDQHETRICDDVISILNREGWTVIPMYIGKSSAHERRYTMFSELLKETGKYERVIRFNRGNCNQLLVSMYQAQAERRKDGFGKDKSTEKDPLFPARDSTHYSEALDTLAFGILESPINFIDEELSLGLMMR